MSAPDLSRARWRKSIRSNGQNACVEAADVDGGIAVRDSKNPTGPVLVFSGLEWTAFLQGVRDGEFELS